MGQEEETKISRSALACLLILGFIHQTQGKIFHGNKTIKIGGFFELENKLTGKVNPQIGIHIVEAFLFAIDQVNKNSSFLYGFKFSTEIEKDGIIRPAKDILSNLIYKFFAGSNMKQSALAPYKPYDAYEVSVVANALSYPVVSYSAPFIINAKSNQYFFRTVPEDSFRAMAMIDLLLKIGWNYIAVISSNDRDGDDIARKFLNKAADKKICYSHYVSLPENAAAADFEQAVLEVSAFQESKGLILFTTVDDSIGLLRAMRKHNLTRKFQIIAASGFTNYMEITEGNEDILEGSISIEYATKELQGFRDHFLALKMDSRSYTKFTEFWEWTFNCKISGAVNGSTKACTKKENLREGTGYYPNTPIHTVVNAVFSLAHVFRQIIEQRCTTKESCDRWEPSYIFLYSKQFGDVLKNNSFADGTLIYTDPVTKIDHNIVQYEFLNFVRNDTHYINKKVGNWSFRREGLAKTGKFYLEQSYNGTIMMEATEVRWQDNSPVMTSSCRLPCPVGWIAEQKRDYRLAKCCWSCIECKKNDITRNNLCIDCGKDKKPDAEKRSCVLLPIKYFGSEASEFMALKVYMGFSSFGIICTLFVAAMFVKNNNNRIVRASGRELCYFMLAGICLMFTIPFTFAFKPSAAVCSVQVVLPGIALCVCYSPLFLKTNRIYRIFCNAKTSISRPPLISPQSQLLLLLFIISVQILLGVIWIVSNSPDAQPSYEPGEYVMFHCGDEGTKMILNLLFSVIFMICCTWYAFKTRNFPKNYNESKFIGFTMYITCICWAVFMPMYFISKEDHQYTRAHLLCAIMICIGFLTLFGLFGQKIKLLMFPSLVDENAPPVPTQASRAAADPNKYQVQIHKIDALSMCKEPPFIHSNSVVVNKHAGKA
ncbi:metabotropic glutamate receptor 3-like [Rhopilema esculentum]|uniref:metabotropic glutamate receptor 3-like n=1 Tax=Rhopilema esculentum TaxID=499914 RepID=UPI0031D76309